MRELGLAVIKNHAEAFHHTRLHLETVDFQMGLDLGKRGLISADDILVFGALGGFVHADLDYDANPRAFDHQGGQVGGYATYLRGGLFVDTLLNVHLMEIDIGRSLGFPDSLDAKTVGVRTLRVARQGRGCEMTMLATVFRVLVGLFVDDGALALAIIMVVLLSWIFAALLPNLPLAAGAMLLIGSLGVLLANVMKAAER